MKTGAKLSRTSLSVCLFSISFHDRYRYRIVRDLSSDMQNFPTESYLNFEAVNLLLF